MNEEPGGGLCSHKGKDEKREAKPYEKPSITPVPSDKNLSEAPRGYCKSKTQHYLRMKGQSEVFEMTSRALEIVLIAFSAFIIVRQWQAMDWANRLTETNIQASNSLSSATIDAMKESNRITRQTLELSQRAKLFMYEFSASQQNVDLADVSFRLANVGASTAQDLHVRVTRHVGNELPVLPTGKLDVRNEFERTDIIGPGQEWSAYGHFYTLPVKTAGSLLKADTKLRIYGRVTYSDPFCIERELRFCREFRGPLIMPPWWPCDSGNLDIACNKPRPLE